MEKRLFLSMVLSFLILYAWFGFIAPPSKSNHLKQTSNLISGDKQLQAVVALGENTVETKVDVRQIVSDQINSVIESDKLRVTFSNLGGQITEIMIRDYAKVLPVTDILSLHGFDEKSFVKREISETEIHYIFDSEDYRIVRAYVLSKDGYDIKATTQLISKSQMSKDIEFGVGLFKVDAFSLDNSANTKNNKHDQALDEYVIKSQKETHRKSSAFKFTSKENTEVGSKVSWAGFRDRYYCLVVVPEFENTGYKTTVFTDKILNIDLKPRTIKLEPGQEQVFSSTIYAGPEKTKILKKYEGGIAEIKRFYRFELFDAIAKFIYWVMHGLYYPLKNWGLVIIALSVLIYFSTYPLTLKGMTSMKRMQALQPKMTALREKYQKNPEKLNKEIMELYKTEKVNPMGGCLPSLLQMPIFIGLYQVLWRDVSLRGANFLWIKDLSEPDRLIVLSKSLPLMGNEINILPILMIVVMAFQQNLSSKSMVSTDPQQIAQQKMMARVMPVFIGFIFYKFASGLALYFTLFYLFSTITQLKMNKQAQAV